MTDTFKMVTPNEIEDRHEIASIINGCLRDGYCNASQLARRITQAGYGNVSQAIKEFAEKLKSRKFDKDMFNDFAGATYVVLVRDIDELLNEYEVEE